MDVLEKYDVEKRIYLADLDFDRMVQHTNMERKYKPLPKYPAIVRDIAIVVDMDVTVGEIQKEILSKGQGLIENVELFDVYTGEQVQKGKKSLAFSITYRSYERTLIDDEVNAIQDSIVSALESRFDAKLRS